MKVSLFILNLSIVYRLISLCFWSWSFSNIYLNFFVCSQETDNMPLPFYRELVYSGTDDLMKGNDVVIAQTLLDRDEVTKFMLRYA